MIEADIMKGGVRLKLRRSESHGKSQGAGWNHLGGLEKSVEFMTKIVLGRLIVSQEQSIFGKKCIDLNMNWNKRTNILKFSGLRIYSYPLLHHK